MGPPRPTFGAVTPDDAMDMMFRTQIIQRMAPQGAKRILFSVGVDPSLELDKPLKDPQKPESNISNVKTAGRVADGRPSCAEDGALGRPESPAVLVGSVTVEPNAAVENPTGLLISDGQLPPKIAGRAGSSVGSVISPPLGTLSPPTPGQPGPSKQQSSSVNGLQNSETSEKPNSKPPLPENHELPSAASSAQRAVPKSWADRLKTSGPKPGISKAGPLSATQSPVKPAVEILRTFVPLSAMKPPDIQPRGLVNNGNMCYMNSVLQPLVYCPPFLNLFRRLSSVAIPRSPLLDAIAHFTREFKSKTLNAESGQEKWGDPFAPEYVYDVLQKTGRINSKKGRQEDAEEFFGFLLDGLHEEFSTLLNSDKPRRPSGDELQASEQEQWQEVGRKNRTANARALTVGDSPISTIFGGKTRSVIRAPGQKDSIVVEPFQTLPLDISSDEIRTIKDALVHLTIPETIDDFVSSTRGTVTATKQYFLDALPPVLILHLKRFVYSSNRGVQKLMKRIGFGPILDIDPAILSPIARTQPPPKYRLFAVVYHVGHLAGGGHYTCSVLRAGGEWLHIDDTAIERTTEDDVIAAARPGYDPYLLYYIRV